MLLAFSGEISLWILTPSVVTVIQALNIAASVTEMPVKHLPQDKALRKPRAEKHPGKLQLKIYSITKLWIPSDYKHSPFQLFFIFKKLLSKLL